MIYNHINDNENKLIQKKNGKKTSSLIIIVNSFLFSFIYRLSINIIDNFI